MRMKFKGIFQFSIDDEERDDEESKGKHVLMEVRENRSFFPIH